MHTGNYNSIDQGFVDKVIALLNLKNQNKMLQPILNLS